MTDLIAAVALVAMTVVVLAPYARRRPRGVEPVSQRCRDRLKDHP